MAGRAESKKIIEGQFALSVGDAEMPCPPGWAWTRLLDVARLESGHTPSRRHPEYWDGDIPWIGIKDARAHHGQVIESTTQRVTQAGLDNSAARLLPPGTVCLSRTASIGYVLILGREMATSQDFVDWICSEVVNPAFLMWLFKAEKRSLLRFGVGTTHKTIYYPEVKAFRVCLPPLNEQRRIVDKIEALNQRSRAAREALEQVPPLLERFRQSLLAAAFRGDLTAEWRAQNPDVEPASVLLERIRAERRRRWEEDTLAKQRAKGKDPKDDKWKASYKEPESADPSALPDLPQGWCWATVGELASEVRYGTSAKCSMTGEVPVLRMGNLEIDGTLSLDRLKYLPAGHADFPRLLLESGDVVFNRTNSAELVGKTAVYEGSPSPCSLASYLIRVRLLDGFRPGLLAAFINSADGRAWIRSVVSQQVGQANVNGTKLRALTVPLPPAAEQEELLEAVQRVAPECRTILARVRFAKERLERLDQAILAKAFRGELVPQDPKDEPASVLLERIREQRARAEPPKKRGRKRKTPAVPQPRPKSKKAKPKKAKPSGSNRTNGLGLSAVLGALKRDALHRIADAEEIELAERRSLDGARQGIAQADLSIEAALGHLKRDELKAICRALDLDDCGQVKAALRERILSGH